MISGAGLDTDSGIPDFRSSDGLYSKAPEEILSIDNFYKKPTETISFIKEHMLYPNAKPNDSHFLLASLENTNRNIYHITQNITSLLEDAGASNVIHVHGKIGTAKCINCGKEYPMNNVHTGKECKCSKSSLVKPSITFYGESIDNEFEAFQLVKEADLILILGTSLTVYPVAELPNYRKKDTPIILITKSETYLDLDKNVLKFNDDISETLKKYYYNLSKKLEQH